MVNCSSSSAGAKAIDRKIKFMLDSQAVPYFTFTGDQAGYDNVINCVLKQLGRQ